MNLAEALRQARQTGLELELEPPALTVEEGYAVARQLAGGLGEQVGWKVGATSGPAQASLGTGEPIYGRVFASGLWRSGDAVALPGDRDAEAEPEVLLRLRRDPGAVFSPDDVAEVRLGLEINRPSRSDAFTLGAGFIVADNAAHVGLVIGPAIPLELLAAPEVIGVRLIRNGSLVSEGTAAAVLGNPLRSAEWLAAKRAGAERALRQGDWIATGAMCRSCALALGDEVIADFGVGWVSVTRT